MTLIFCYAPADFLNSADAECFPRQPGGTDWLMKESFAEAQHRLPPKPKGRDCSFKQTSNYVPKSSYTSRNGTWNGQGQSMASGYSSGIILPYHDWSLYLTTSLTNNFDFHLYNEFRRSALDDLLTRGVDQGFHELMRFYRNCLLHRRSVPCPVMYDMVRFSKPPNLPYHTLAFNMIYETLASGAMKSHNQRKVSNYFNTQHG
jgi:la-related protein 1